MKYFLIILFFPSFCFAQNFQISLFDFSFLEDQNIECCDQIFENQKAPYDAFLIKPYVLVLLKDTVDNLHKDAALQLKHQENLCDNKMSLYQEQCDSLINDLKSQAIYHEEQNVLLHKDNLKLQTEINIYKFSLYVGIPVSLIAGIYIHSLF